MQRHIVRALLLAVAAAFVVAVGPVAAKIPYFSIEVSPDDPVDGDVVVVVLRMWNDATQTQPATWGEEFGVELRLLEFHGDAGIVPVDFQRFDDASYRGEVPLAAGTWRLVPFPPWGGDVIGSGDGYSAPVSVTVRERPSYSTAGAIAAAGLLGVLGLLAAGPAHRWLRRRGRWSVTR